MASFCRGKLLFALATGICLSTAAADEQPTTRLPYTPSLDVRAMDPAVDPCVDLYQYACGGWIVNNPIPPDQSRWSVYGKAYLDNQQYLWGILQDNSIDQPGRNETQQLIGDYFAACMDVERVEQLGGTPLDSDLQAIAELDDKSQLGDLIARLIGQTDSSNFFFAVGSQQDAQDSTIMIGEVIAGGLGLPDRDYYLDASADKEAIRRAYLLHLAAMFELLDEPAQQAAKSAAVVMRIETALARASLTRV